MLLVLEALHILSKHMNLICVGTEEVKLILFSSWSSEMDWCRNSRKENATSFSDTGLYTVKVCSWTCKQLLSQGPRKETY